MTVDERRDELAERLHEVHARIAAACRAADRDVESVDLLVVTKTFPASDVALLAELGVTEVAESRDQEARAKVAALTAGGHELRWHMIGQVQRNKAKSVASWADVVESVDRPGLADALSAGAVARDRTVDVLLQVALDPAPEDARGGCAPDLVQSLARHVAALPGLRLGGLMAVAPWPGDPDEAFTRLAQVRARLVDEFPGARTCSAGMSGDLEAAVRHGATQVRVGSAILGTRPPIG